LPKLIKEYYKVDKLDFETSERGFEILYGNPYIDNLIVVPLKILLDDLICRWNYGKDEYDLFFNLTQTIELNYCVIEADHRYYRNNKYRRERFGKMNYYDVETEACGLPESYFGTRGQLYYSDKCHDEAKQWIKKTKERYNADWIILVCLSGSSMHKRFEQAQSICNKILDKYPTSLIVLTGDKDCKPQEFTHERIISKVDKWNFRTVALMSKYFDFVISPETGLVCVAHSWDTPTLQLLTAASWDNHIKYAKNAYWVQSDIHCSPCHKSPQKYYGCPVKDGVPACVVSFNEDEIMSKVEEAYNERITKIDTVRTVVLPEVSVL
jgi:ADP-heptose:LPS heptosyltransferase